MKRNRPTAPATSSCRPSTGIVLTAIALAIVGCTVFTGMAAADTTETAVADAEENESPSEGDENESEGTTDGDAEDTDAGVGLVDLAVGVALLLGVIAASLIYWAREEAVRKRL